MPWSSMYVSMLLSVGLMTKFAIHKVFRTYIVFAKAYYMCVPCLDCCGYCSLEVPSNLKTINFLFAVLAFMFVNCVLWWESGPTFKAIAMDQVLHIHITHCTWTSRLCNYQCLFECINFPLSLCWYAVLSVRCMWRRSRTRETCK